MKLARRFNITNITNVTNITAGFVFFMIFAGFNPSQAREDSPYNQVALQVQVSEKIAHDLMRVSLYGENQDTDPAALAEKTTRIMNVAITTARQASNITVESGSRASYPVYGKDRKQAIAWRERAYLHLESKDFVTLGALLTKLTADLRLEGQQFSISKPERKAHEDGLIKEAIEAFNRRALLASQALGAKGYRLVRLDVANNIGFNPVFRQKSVNAMRMASAEMAADGAGAGTMDSLQIEAGSSEMTVIASGVIEIRFE